MDSFIFQTRKETEKMKKADLTTLARNFQSTLSKHSPEILTGIGIAGMVTTTVLAVRTTPKALRLIEEKKEEEQVDKLPPIEVVKVSWKCYIPSAVVCVTSIACLIGASSTNAKRNAALAAAYTLSDTAFREYKEKVIETIGEEKEKEVKTKVNEERIKNNPIQPGTKEVYITEKGNTLCYDAISSRYFRSDIDKIKRAETSINYKMLNEMYVSLNDFYDEIGLSRSSLGDDLGWRIEDGQLRLEFDYVPAEDGEPCLVIDYNIAPKYDYSKFL